MDLVLPVALFLTVAAVLFVLQPIVTGRRARLEGEVEEEESEAEHQKRVALRALRDVEYDYHAGKLDDADYARLKSEVAAEALAAMDAEETDDGAGTGVSGNGRSDAGDGDDLEAEIARYRTALREGRSCSGCGAVNETAARFCTQCGTRLGARFCPSCGEPRSGDASACESCGAPLS